MNMAARIPPNKAVRLAARLIKNVSTAGERAPAHSVEIKIPKTKNAIKRNEVMIIVVRGLKPRIFIIINLY